jgi:hypothetical protein
MLIGLERPLWVVEHGRSTWEEIDRQKEHEREMSGSVGAQVTAKILKYVRKFGGFRFDPEMSYSKTAAGL